MTVYHSVLYCNALGYLFLLKEHFDGTELEASETELWSETETLRVRTVSYHTLVESVYSISSTRTH